MRYCLVASTRDWANGCFLRKVFNVTKKTSESERLEEPSDESISKTESAQHESKDSERNPNVSTSSIPVSTHVDYDYAIKGMLGFHQVCDRNVHPGQRCQNNGL